MATYLIGDVHGCYHELMALLKQVNFKPDKDVLWLTGDLVARGSNSLEVLRYVKSLGDSVRVVLGNHDLHLLSVHLGIRRSRTKDRTNSLLEASDVDELLKWLRLQPVLQIDEDKKLVMVHAGITPQWDLNTAKKCAQDIETMLSSNSYPIFLNAMYDSVPNDWNQNLSGLSRLRFISNVFTRIRYCFPNGQLNLNYKGGAKNALLLKPWFSIPSSITEEYSIVFGHWSTLKARHMSRGIYALDTGCCWGGKLTCLRWEDKKYFFQSSNRYMNPMNKWSLIDD